MPNPLLPGEYLDIPKNYEELDFRINVAMTLKASYSVQEIQELTGDRCPALMFN